MTSAKPGKYPKSALHLIIKNHFKYQRTHHLAEGMAKCRGRLLVKATPKSENLAKIYDICLVRCIKLPTISAKESLII